MKFLTKLLLAMPLILFYQLASATPTTGQYVCDLVSSYDGPSKHSLATVEEAASHLTMDKVQLALNSLNCDPSKQTSTTPIELQGTIYAFGVCCVSK